MRLNDTFALIVALAIVGTAPPVWANDTPKYTCGDLQCDDECIGQEDGLCFLPFECPYDWPNQADDHPDYDGCSTPPVAIEASGVLLGLFTRQSLARYNQRFGYSPDRKSAPCFRHDVCYRIAKDTHGWGRGTCDNLFVVDMKAQCDDIPRLNVAERMSCWVARTLMGPAVKSFGYINYRKESRRGTCCNFFVPRPDYSTRCQASWNYINGELPDYPNCTGDPGDPGCECLDVEQIDDYAFARRFIDEEQFSPDGAGSFLNSSGPTDLGQYCPGDDLVCGRHRVASGNFTPVCQECGVDTDVGCSCVNDGDCTNVAEDGPLRCFGADGDGWRDSAGSPASGTCLPDPDDPRHSFDLEETPWFCLENCDVLDRVSEDTRKACIYRQFAAEDEDLIFPHGTCVALVNQCNDSETAECEARSPGHYQCDTRNSGVDTCEPECLGSDHARCTELLYPSDYVCVEGACVPPACEPTPGSDPPSYCELYR